MRRAALLLAAGALWAAAAGAQPAQTYAQRYAALCATCHGGNGRSEMAGTPSLAGQPGFYVVTQLFLFREGRRDNEAMTAVAKSLSDDDLRGFSELVGKMTPVPAPALAPVPDPARMARGKALVSQHLCVNCHGADLGGGEQVARLAGQREDYLALALKEFKAGKRVGYTPAMSEALGGLAAVDLDTLAHYLAHLP
ncbi:c-type cytochrome [uncultured Ramlibacter sp.]|uniref:c-type cytochrome n=1 Tax=uncultured Ramlibacter sp. TaxID=260755 RepID=UPI00262E673B|nr:c-type cytochrome [uncultured Ramlibacter sp.]